MIWCERDFVCFSAFSGLGRKKGKKCIWILLGSAFDCINGVAPDSVG